MRYSVAKKLHNDDEVKVKSTKEIVKVINTEVDTKNIWISAITNELGITRLHHTEVE